MPVWVEVDPETGRGIGVGTGELSLEQIKAGARALWSNPGFRGNSVVWDVTDARFSLAKEEIRELAEFVKSFGSLRPPARVAFVALNELEFGQLRMFEIFREEQGIEIHVFREIHAALLWLDERPRLLPDPEQTSPQPRDIEG